jgi:hypothetical protein
MNVNFLTALFLSLDKFDHMKIDQNFTLVFANDSSFCHPENGNEMHNFTMSRSKSYLMIVEFSLSTALIELRNSVDNSTS